MGTGFVELVDAGIHLATHGVERNGKLASHTRLPRRPCRCVERRASYQRFIQSTRKTLGSRDAYAHARERPGSTTHEHGVYVDHRKARIRERFDCRVYKLLVRVSTAQVVMR